MIIPAHVEKFGVDFTRMLAEIAHADTEAAVPPSMFKKHYRELLATAMATGELDHYHEDLYVDPDSGILCVKLGLAVPAIPQFMQA